MATYEITDKVTMRFAKIEEIISQLYIDTSAMIDKDKDTKIILPLLRAINLL